MSYAYFQGQEVQALDYYKKLLALETDAKAREQLTVLIAKLEKIVREKETKDTSGRLTLHNASAA